jgi:hypothetical protein
MKHIKALVDLWYFPVITGIVGGGILIMLAWAFPLTLHQHLVNHLPVMKVPSPLTDTQLYQAIMETPSSVWINTGGCLLFMLIGINLFLDNRISRFPSWFSADFAQAQLAALCLGLPLKVYVAVWYHALGSIYNLWAVCAAYCLAFLTIYGLYVSARFYFWRLPVKLYHFAIRVYQFMKQIQLNLADNW